MLHKLFGRRRNPSVAAMYDALVEQARLPVFYESLGVSDTLDGRFDLLALNAGLIMRRLKGEGDKARAFNQALFDHMFRDMDSNLRVIGVSDLRVGNKVKDMAKAFYGRTVAYDRALDAGDRAQLRQALIRNLYRGEEADEAALEGVAGYVQDAAAELDRQDAADIMAGKVAFPVPAGAAARHD